MKRYLVITLVFLSSVHAKASQAEDLYFGEMEQNVQLKITETYPQKSLTRYQAERALSRRVRKTATPLVKEAIRKELINLGVPYSVQYLTRIQDASEAIWISSRQQDDMHFIKANPTFNCTILTLTNHMTELTPDRMDRFDLRVFGERSRIVFERTDAPAFLLMSSTQDNRLRIRPDPGLRDQIVEQLRLDGDRLYKAKIVLTLRSMNDKAEWKMSGPELMDFLDLSFKDQLSQCWRFLETRLHLDQLRRSLLR